MTKIELARLAAGIAVIRPDWPEPSLRTFLAEHLAHRPLHDVTVALAWVATDPDTRSPARVLEAGPWWQASRTRDIPTTRNDCSRHEHAGLRVDQSTGDTECAGCWADSHADTTSHAEFRRPEPPAAELAIIRGEIHRAHPTKPRERRKVDVEALAQVRRELEQARAAAADATSPPDVSRADDVANPDAVQRPA